MSVGLQCHVAPLVGLLIFIVSVLVTTPIILGIATLLLVPLAPVCMKCGLDLPRQVSYRKLTTPIPLRAVHTGLDYLFTWLRKPVVDVRTSS